MHALARWGARSLGPPSPDEQLTPGWSLNAIEAIFVPEAARGVTATYVLRIGDEVATMRVDDGTRRRRDGAAEEPDLVVDTDSVDPVRARRRGRSRPRTRSPRGACGSRATRTSSSGSCRCSASSRGSSQCVPRSSDVRLGRPRVPDREPQHVAPVEARVREEDLARRVDPLEQRLVRVVAPLEPEADEREAGAAQPPPSPAPRAPSPRTARPAGRARGSSPGVPRGRGSEARPRA